MASIYWNELHCISKRESVIPNFIVYDVVSQTCLQGQYKSQKGLKKCQVNAFFDLFSIRLIVPTYDINSILVYGNLFFFDLGESMSVEEFCNLFLEFSILDS